MALNHEEAQELRETYALLSKEELAGMRGDDEDHDAIIDSILGGAPAADADEDEDEKEAAPAPDDEDDEDDEEEVAEIPAAPEAPAPEAEAPAAPVADIDVPPLDQSYLAEKFDTKLAELDAANAESLTKLMSGEIEAADYAKAQAQYLRDRDALKDQRTAEAEWGKTVHNFQAQAAKDNGIDYFNDTEKAEALDGWVKHLANNPKNADKPGDWFLKEAHKKVMVEYGVTAQNAQKAAENVASEKKVAPKTARTPKLDNLPPTLSGLPAAAPAASGDGGEFDHLARLTGMDFEKAIARMTPDQRARYEAE